MNAFLKISLLLSALSAVACSDKKSQAFVDQCSSDALCVQRYQQAALSIVGSAAVAGLAQVADAGAVTQTGQVPSVSILPVSVADAVSNAEIQAQSQKIAQQLQQIETGSSQVFVPASVVDQDEASRAPASQTANNLNGEIIR